MEVLSCQKTQVEFYPSLPLLRNLNFSVFSTYELFSFMFLFWPNTWVGFWQLSLESFSIVHLSLHPWIEFEALIYNESLPPLGVKPRSREVRFTGFGLVLSKKHQFTNRSKRGYGKCLVNKSKKPLTKSDLLHRMADYTHWPALCSSLRAIVGDVIWLRSYEYSETGAKWCLPYKWDSRIQTVSIMMNTHHCWVLTRIELPFCDFEIMR